MKYQLLILLSFSILPFSFCNAETIAQKHATIEQQDKITRGTFRGFGENLKEHPISKIGIERSYCYGTCPAYMFEITSSGDVLYEGFGYVEKMGTHIGKIDTYHLRNIFEYVDESGFFNLNDTYTASVTDLSNVYTLAVKNGEEKIVKHYANSGPIALWSIEQHFDSLLEKVEWHEKND